MIAGESRNDQDVLRVLLEALCPKACGRIVYLDGKFPLRDASEVNLRDRVRRFAQKVRARAEREKAAVAGVFLHEDLDEVDSGRYLSARRRVQHALTRELGHAHYVLAVWEIEAWLLLFPDALDGFNTDWRVPRQYRSRDTGKIHDPKRVLQEQVSRKGPRYRESDAPAIAERAVALNLHALPMGANRAYEAFCADVATRCHDL